MARGQCYQDLDQCPLVKIKKIDGIKVGVEPIKQPEKPSEGDVAFAKKHYPWKG